MKSLVLYFPLYLVLTLLTSRCVAAAENEASRRSGECNTAFVPASGSYQFLRKEIPDLGIAEVASIGEIYYTRLPIFDEAQPEENKAVYRWANRFHSLTREGVIEQQILFEREEPYTEGLLEESARLLRGQNYFYDVDIRPVRLCGDEVDIEVITKDSWSLIPDFSFDRSGGENTYSFSIRDSNILGLGKQIVIGSKEDKDRRSNELVYEDNNVLGSRIRNRTRIADSDDGSNQLFDLNLPFYSLDSRRSWGMSVESETLVDEQYFHGDAITEVEHDIEDIRVEYGFSGGLQQGATRRWTMGYQYRTDKFSSGKDLPAPMLFPIDKELSYPYLGFEFVEDNFDTTFNLGQIYRTEDLHLGHRFYNRLGYAASTFGSDQDRVVVEGFYNDTLLFADNMLWQHSLEWEGQWNLDSSEAEDVIVSYETHYFRRITSRRAFFASLEAVYSKNLNTNSQIVFGGLTGARAYENRFQVGDRRVALTLEERIYTDIHLLNLIRVGGAVFIDVGRAWEPGIDSGFEDELLANIGIGLRLASSKAASGRVAHIDLAFPIRNRNDPDVEKFQIAFNVKSSF